MRWSGTSASWVPPPDTAAGVLLLWLLGGPLQLAWNCAGYEDAAGEEFLCEAFEAYLQATGGTAADTKADDSTVAAFIDFIERQQHQAAGAPGAAALGVDVCQSTKRASGCRHQL